MNQPEPNINMDVLRDMSEHALFEGCRLLQGICHQEVHAELRWSGLSDLTQVLGQIAADESELVFIRQSLHADVDGDAALLMTIATAQSLLKDLLNEARLPELDFAAEEALSEVANVLLNACLATFSDLHGRTYASGLPRVQRRQAVEIVHRLAQGALQVSAQASLQSAHFCLQADWFMSSGQSPFLLIFPAQLFEQAGVLADE